MARIIPLSEGAFTVDGTKKFIPYNPETDSMQQRSGGSLLVEIQPFLVITDQDYILLDAGLGYRNADGVLQIHQHLIDNGVNPMDITKVLMSHLHKDHSGGVGIDNGTGISDQLSFPAAKYYIQRQELEFALNDTTASYVKEDLQCLRDSPNVILVDGNGKIDNYITYELTSAHSKFHQVFWIEENGETIFFGGDDAPQYGQMRNKYVAKYDHNGKKCMELRQEWWKKGSEQHWTFLFYHDVKTPVIKP